jgi:hypothetical protein
MTTVSTARASSPALQPHHAGAAVDQAVQDEFLAQICADEDLLRAEFDAIIADGRDQPSPPARQARCRRPRPPHGRRSDQPAAAGGLRGPLRDPRGEGRSRQRAPPHHQYRSSATPMRTGRQVTLPA